MSPPTTFAGYYEIYKNDSKVYKCNCPPDFDGYQCKLCKRGGGMYKPRLDVCADCDCSDLSDREQCDDKIGHCTCKPGGDMPQAGRQCVSIWSANLCYGYNIRF